MTVDELSMLGDKAFALKLADHGGKSVYALGSALIEGRDPNLKFIRQALTQLEKASSDPKIGAGDRIEMRNIAAELKARFPQIGDKMMTEAQMTSWVRKNCKFASKKTAGIIQFLSPEDLASPQTALPAMERAYKQQKQLGPITQQEVQMDLKAVGEKMGLTGGELAMDKNVQRMMMAIKPELSTGPQNLNQPPQAAMPAPAAPVAPGMPMAKKPNLIRDPAEDFFAKNRKPKV